MEQVSVILALALAPHQPIFYAMGNKSIYWFFDACRSLRWLIRFLVVIEKRFANDPVFYVLS